MLLHPSKVTLIPGQRSAPAPAESPPPDEGLAVGEDGVVLRKRSLRQRVGQGIKKRFSASRNEPADRNVLTPSVSPRQPAEFQPPPDDVIQSPYKHGGRLLQVGRDGDGAGTECCAMLFPPHPTSTTHIHIHTRAHTKTHIAQITVHDDSPQQLTPTPPRPHPLLLPSPAARGLQVSGRRGYLTFMNSSFQQLKEDCDGLPAFKMQQPIG